MASRCGKSHLGVHIGAIHVNLSPVVVYDVRHFPDCRFKYPVCGRVGYHEGRQRITVLLSLGHQVRPVDISLFIAVHDHHLHAGHGCTGGIGAMCRGGDQHHIAEGLVPAFMIFADHQQSGIFTCRAGIGLEGYFLHTGGGFQENRQVMEQLVVALGLIEWHEGVQVAELGPAHRQHFNGRVQFHGA